MLPAWILTVSLAAAAQADLVAAASASSRPPECWPAARAGRTEGSSVWKKASSPGLQRYCALIARAHTRLASDPKAARTAALQAERSLPGRAATLVIQARAALALSDIEGACKLFAQALRIDSRSVQQPLALHDFATALRRAGRLQQALRAYRVLAPRAALLPSRGARARTLLEAAHVSMALPPTDGARPDLHEALSYLREARRDPHHAYRLDVALSLALALDRAGRARQADAILADLRGAPQWADQHPADYTARALDQLALRALALQTVRPADAARLWRRYLATATGDRWTAAAQARLDGLSRPEPQKRRRRRSR